MRYIFAILFFSLLSPVPASLSGTGEIWDVTGQKYISEKSLMNRLEQSRNILLGVRADNRHHHDLAAKIIEMLDKAARTPVILLGNIERSKQNAFAIFAQRHQNSSQPYDATGLDMLLDWANSGQPPWSMARPLFDMAMLRKLPLKASGLSRYELGEIYRGGPDAMPPDVTGHLRTRLRVPLSPQLTRQINIEINREYCGNLPPDVVRKFIPATRVQNGLFARTMAETNPETAVLVAARKHILKAAGVPRLLDRLVGKGNVVTLLFGERGQDMPDEQVDFIWYASATPCPGPRPDPCPNPCPNPCGFLNP